METFTKEEVDARKRAIFDKMSKRGQRRVIKIGFDQWDPFQEPKDPIDIRKDPTRRTAQTLVQEFLETQSRDAISPAYKQALMEMAIGMVNKEDRAQAIFEFSCWYRKLLDKKGL